MFDTDGIRQVFKAGRYWPLQQLLLMSFRTQWHHSSFSPGLPLPTTSTVACCRTLSHHTINQPTRYSAVTRLSISINPKAGNGRITQNQPPKRQNRYHFSLFQRSLSISPVPPRPKNPLLISIWSKRCRNPMRSLLSRKSSQCLDDAFLKA